MNRKTNPLQQVIILAISCFGCTPDEKKTPVEEPENRISVSEAFPALKFTSPVDIQSTHDGSNRLFIVEQKGIIKVFKNESGTQTSSTFLDISSKVVSGGESGLLGLAFDPNYKTNGYFYVNYTTGSQLKSVIARYQNPDPGQNAASPSSELILLTFDQPYANHNGGALAFGKDGYLYIATGDGGSGGDPHNNAQNRQNLLGKILRIDVNNITNTYKIPADNPYKGNKDGFRDEIYAYGLRNPWRMSFDSETNELYVGDVGQNKREEIDRIVKGGNYGWRLKEGVDCYNPSSNCNGEGLTEPIFDYDQTKGDRSITGGYVYRGKSLPTLKGQYIYADFISGRMWALEVSNERPKNNTLLMESKIQVSSFGVDESNEIYMAGYGDGKIYKFISKSGN